MSLLKPRVLFVTSEVYPLVKTGGLGDVSYALPNALRQLGVDIRILLPGYTSVLKELPLIEVQQNISVFPTLEPINLMASVMHDGTTPIYVIDCPSLYRRDGGPYQDEHGKDWPDNALRFGLLSKMAALFGQGEFLFKPEIIHCNDWQSGLTPAYLHYTKKNHAQTMASIHNIAYQGIFGADIMGLLGLPPASFQMNGLEYYGSVSFLKASLFYADWISTVSPTYAKDIQTPAYGYGLHGLLAERYHHLTGILNGIDTDIWNPATDEYIFNHYDVNNLAGKAENTKQLRQKLGLEPSHYKPLLGMVSRFAYQKGLDLLLPIIPEIINKGTQLAILGSGDKGIEEALLNLAKMMPGQMSVTLGYDEALAHQIEAGADVFLMPSLFEPCGLNQMYSMHYGTIPIVRRTGGLADTVIDAIPVNLNQQTATGFVFEQEDSRHLLQCVERAILLFRDKTNWQKLQKTGMTRDFSWRNSAQQYLDLYQQLLK